MTWKQIDARLSQWLFKSLTVPLDMLVPYIRTTYWLQGDIFTYKRPFREPVSLRLIEFDEIGVETTDQGPFAEDVFWVLKKGDVRLRIPSYSPVFKKLMNCVDSLEGFDWQPFIEAQSCADNAYFLCWKRHPSKKEKHE